MTASVYVGLALTAHTTSTITTSAISQVTVKANAAPTVSLTSPANNASFAAPATITISATATDDGTISKVEFYNGTTLLNSDNSSPYSYTWSGVGGGTYTLKAIAYDNLNVSTTSATRTVTVTTGCSAPQWTAGNTSYAAGTVVKNTVGGIVKKYQCTVAGWCQSTSAFYYEPGNGAAWTDCWTDLGVCTAKFASSDLSTNSTSSYMEVFPNPSSDKVTVSGSVLVDGIVKISIYNSVGNEILRKDVSSSNGSYECEMEIVNLPNGVYTIKANAGDVVLIEKLIIN
jgi:chitinase